LFREYDCAIYRNHDTLPAQAATAKTTVRSWPTITAANPVAMIVTCPMVTSSTFLFIALPRVGLGVHDLMQMVMAPKRRYAARESKAAQGAIQCELFNK
jgi:hypothetical protein